MAEAFRRAYGDHVRVYPERFEAEFGQTPYDGFNFFTGHVGFTVASEIGGDLITVLRDPVDRFLSTYYFLRQMFNSGSERSYKASLAARFDLDQFARIRGEPVLQDELHNRMTWQLAHSHRVARRSELAVGDAELVQIAMDNLSKFAIVGLQTDMADLGESVRRRYNVHLSIDRVNVTGQRRTLEDIPSATLDRIEWWVHLDRELYRGWINRDRR